LVKLKLEKLALIIEIFISGMKMIKL